MCLTSMVEPMATEVASTIGATASTVMVSVGAPICSVVTTSVTFAAETVTSS